MAPTILIIGATGNTGKGVVRLLPVLLKTNSTGYRILGLTRSLSNPSSKELAALGQVEMHEKDWTTIDAVWLRSQEVERVFIAPHNLLHQFAEESALHLALLHAGVKYVVRVSTNVEYTSPTSDVYYGRSHWAIEHLLSQPEFENLQWTSLQPNYFTKTYLASAVDWVRAYEKTGTQGILSVFAAADTAVGVIDAEDVGNIGAHLLALKDVAPHNQARYVLNGPEDVTGKHIVKLVENYAAVKIQNVEYKAVSRYRSLFKGYPEKIMPSIIAGLEILLEGKCSLVNNPTSKEVEALSSPKRTIEDTFKVILEN